MGRKLWVTLVTLAVALALAAPALAAGQSRAAAATPTFNVYAAASLSKVFPAMVPVFKAKHPTYKHFKFRFNFQGTDVLTAQIEQGAPADVFAGASTKYGDALYHGGVAPTFIKAPVNFCQNKLVVITPAKNPAGITVTSLGQLANPGVVIAIGDSAVPIGTYTRTVLNNLSNAAAPYLAPYGTTYGTSVLANAIAQVPNVNAVVLLVETDNVDAGFCYVSDAHSAGALVKRIVIPNTYQSNPLPTYPIAALRHAAHPILAQRWVNFVMGKTGQKLLHKYDFMAKPAVVPAS